MYAKSFSITELGRKVILFNFSPTWSCVLLPRLTTSSWLILLSVVSFDTKQIYNIFIPNNSDVIG